MPRVEGEEWYRQVQFISAVPMPPELADEFGTTVNGMWAAPEGVSPEVAAEAHRTGQRALFSLALVALTPNVYEDQATAWLLDEVCRDIEDEPALVDWYYWEPKPVYSVCIYSDPFRSYLLDYVKGGVDAGMDVVNLDEIMTNVGLMNRDPHGSGFCARCLERFQPGLRDASELRNAIRTDDQLYKRYRRFHEREAFRVVRELIAELHSYAAARNKAFAISANVAYLGNNVAALGALWGCLWGPHIDFVLMENDYRVEGHGSHVILPRGKFTAWYKLGSSFKGTPTWICPSIHVPHQLAGEDRRRYYELMFLEAYANGGRWGYYWGPGVDLQTRREATAPDALKDHIRFISGHRDLYEQATSMNELAVLYLDGPIMRRPEGHEKYLALAQALAEAGYQFDVLYGGDGEFNPDELDHDVLQRYATILVPEARDLGSAPGGALERYGQGGGGLVVYSDSPLDHAVAQHEDGQVLADFWRNYRDLERDRIVATVDGLPSARIRTSNAAVNAVRYAVGERQVVHLLNYGYVAESDSVIPARDLHVQIPWRGGGEASATYLTIGDESPMPYRVDGDSLNLEIPQLDLYGVILLQAISADLG